MLLMYFIKQSAQNYLAAFDEKILLWVQWFFNIKLDFAKYAEIVTWNIS